jgi:hypothetical protein
MKTKNKPYLKSILKEVQSAYFCKEATMPEENAITFLPAYSVPGNHIPEGFCIYQTDNGIFLHDYGITLANLDAIFELGEADVIKNLVAILKHHGMWKTDESNLFTTRIEEEKPVKPQILRYLLNYFSPL